jgi:hypothetical protein
MNDREEYGCRAPSAGAPWPQARVTPDVLRDAQAHGRSSPTWTPASASLRGAAPSAPVLAHVRTSDTGPATPAGWEANIRRLEIYVAPPRDHPGFRDMLERWLYDKLKECQDALWKIRGRRKSRDLTGTPLEADIKINALSRGGDAALKRERMVENLVDALVGGANKGRGVAVGNHILCLLADFRDCRLLFDDLCAYAEIYASVHGAS